MLSALRSEFVLLFGDGDGDEDGDEGEENEDEGTSG